MAKQSDKPKIPWTSLPTAHMVEVVDYETHARARFWLWGAKRDPGFWDFCKAVEGDASDLLYGGITGSGAWEEGKPWARLVSSATLTMRELGAEAARREEQLAEDWERVMGIIGKRAEEFAGPGRWVVQQAMGHRGRFAEGQDQECGMALLALDEAGQLALAAGPALAARKGPRAL